MRVCLPVTEGARFLCIIEFFHCRQAHIPASYRGSVPWCRVAAQTRCRFLESGYGSDKGSKIAMRGTIHFKMRPSSRGHTSAFLILSPSPLDKCPGETEPSLVLEGGSRGLELAASPGTIDSISLLRYDIAYLFSVLLGPANHGCGKRSRRR